MSDKPEFKPEGSSRQALIARQCKIAMKSEGINALTTLPLHMPPKVRTAKSTIKQLEPVP